MIELSGASAGNAVGLKIGGDDTTVRGLVINRFMNGFGAIWVLVSDPEAGVSDVHIEGNLIGTNATGTAALGNKVGLTFSDVASGSIGGASPAARNVISGNTGDGIFAFPNIFLPSSTLSIQGNFIGLAVDGTSPLGNGGRGIYLPDGVAPGTTIGGQDAGAGNKIAYNVGTGVVLQSATFGIPILSNAIFGNGTLGIDLNRDGATPNDAGDADTGPNNLQNYPEISHATRDAGQLKVTYNVPSTPANSVYPIRVEFFLADANGQGKTFLGFDTFSNDDFDAGGKTADFTTNSPTKVFDKLVVTATDDSGIRNTSEFSPTVTIVSPWQNHNPGRLRWDVTDDTHVVADDVLTIINYINAKGSGKVPDNAANAKPFLDVDGDNSVVAADVIDVINYINAGKKLGGEAEATWEGEAPAEPVAANSQSPLAIGQSPAAGDLMALIAADVAAQAARKQRI
jgi:hypothetical protein